MKKFFLLLLTLIAFGLQLSAQTNLSVQGTIQNYDGSAVDNGQYDVTFKLYVTDAGGTPVWSETQTVNVTGGIYSVLLGEVEPLTAAFDQTYYLGITIPGGPELTPRSRLTSSPYALSLIGQDNIFPSTGGVGVGTTAPAASYQLHVANADGDGKMLVEGTDAAKIVLKKGGDSQTISYDGTAISIPGTVNLSGTANIETLVATNFNYSPTNFAVTGKLAAGQASVDANNAFKVTGHSFMDGGLEISNGPTLTASGFAFFNNSFTGGNIGYNGGSTTQPFPLKVNGNVLTTGAFVAISDRRIKKDFHLSENLADLSTLRKLRVTDYRHIDETTNGLEFKKGFIAQEVRETFPEAVTIAPGFIPNVYALSAKTQLKAGKMTISLDKNHEFAVGDEVKLLLQDGAEKRVSVVEVVDASSFAVDWTGEAAADQVFVLGKKVADFHSVDYDRIFTLNVSATQELARQVEQLKAENQALRGQNEGLRSDLNGMNERLSKLESSLTGTVQK